MISPLDNMKEKMEKTPDRFFVQTTRQLDYAKNLKMARSKTEL